MEQDSKTEDRLFYFITQNWRGKPLVSHEVTNRPEAGRIPRRMELLHRAALSVKCISYSLTDPKELCINNCSILADL